MINIFLIKKELLILFIIIGIVCISYELYAQSTFELLIENDRDEVIHTVIRGFNNDYIMAGVTRVEEKSNNNESYYNGLLLIVNDSGIITLRKEFEIGGTAYYNQKLLKRHDGNYIFMYYYKKVHSNPDSSFNIIYLENLSPELDIIWSKKHNWLCGHDFAYKLDADITEGDSLILIGNSRNSQPWGVFFYLFNQNGDSLNVNFVEGTSSPIEVWTVHSINDNENPFVVTSMFFEGFQNTILELDKNLNINELHHFGQMGYDNICPNFSSKYYNGELYISGWTCGSYSTPKWQMGAFSTDKDFNLKNELFWGTAMSDFPAFGGAIDFTDTSKIYIGGTTQIHYFAYYDIPTHIIINQCNSELQSNWLKYYGGDSLYQLNKILATEDGGCLFVSTRYDYTQPLKKRDIYIIKVDSNGIIKLKKM